jgi:hypothetical protein
MYNVFFEGQCLAANVLEDEIENIYIGYIMSEMDDEFEEEF